MAALHAPAVARFPVNLAGRDFIVGDIHGAFDLVVAAMRQVSFDPSKDRLFAVGDLIDRGPDSHRCLRFLAQPYVHSVRGNHEDMLLELYDEDEPSEEMLYFASQFNGLEWWRDVASGERADIIRVLRDLPLAIEIETPRGTVGVIHADVPSGMNWQDFLSSLEARDPRAMQSCLWGRTRLTHGDLGGVPGVGRLFVGHTPQWDGLRMLGNVVALDSGAVFGLMGAKEEGHLTLASALAATAVLQSPRKSPGQLVELKNGASEAPFGSYASASTSVPASLSG